MASWLKEIGIVLANIIGIAQIIEPFLPKKIQTIEDKGLVVANDLANLFNVIVQQEATGVAAGLSGLQKLQGAVALSRPIVIKTLADAGLQFDPAKMEGVSSGMVQMMNGLVSILNSAKTVAQ